MKIFYGFSSPQNLKFYCFKFLNSFFEISDSVNSVEMFSIMLSGKCKYIFCKWLSDICDFWAWFVFDLTLKFFKIWIYFPYLLLIIHWITVTTEILHFIVTFSLFCANISALVLTYNKVNGNMHFLLITAHMWVLF